MNVNTIKEQIQREAELAHKQHGLQSTCCLGTGLGKTMLLINRIEEVLTNNPEAAVIVSGARQIYITNTQKEFVKFGKEALLERIVFTCNKSLKNYYDQHWDFICIDESHKEVEMYLDFLLQALSQNENVEILCLTGTPKSPKYEKLLYRIVPISYSKGVDESIGEGVINDYMIHIFNYELTGTDFKNYQYWYQRYVNNKSRRKFPFELQKIKAIFANSKQKIEYFNFFKEKLKNYKTLVFANSIAQAEQLGIPALHSEMSKTERKEVFDKFCEDELGFLVNVGILKESVSIPNLSRGLQLCIESSEISFHQLLGRFCRLSVDSKAHLLILCAENTLERKWLMNALYKIDKARIKEYNLKEWI